MRNFQRHAFHQCALVIRKGGFEEVQARGLDALRDQIATLAPFLAPKVHEIQSWDDIKMLTELRCAFVCEYPCKVDEIKSTDLVGLLRS
jgi:hypothetical protein